MTTAPTSVPALAGAACQAVCGPYAGCSDSDFPGVCRTITEPACLARPARWCDLKLDFYGMTAPLQECPGTFVLPTAATCDASLTNKYQWIADNLSALEDHYLSNSAALDAAYSWLLPLLVQSLGCENKYEDYFVSTLAPTTVAPTMLASDPATVAPTTLPATFAPTLAPTSAPTALSIGSCDSTLEQDIIPVGHIFTKGRFNLQTSAEACCESCEATKLTGNPCVAWTWDAQTHNCALRDEFGWWKDRANDGRVSGLMNYKPTCISQTVSRATGTRAIGSPILKKIFDNIATEEECCQKCAGFPLPSEFGVGNCVAYRWKDTGACHLLDQIHVFNASPRPGWTSGAFVADADQCTRAAPCPPGDLSGI